MKVYTHSCIESQFKHNKLHCNCKLPIPSFCFVPEHIRREVRSLTLGESVSSWFEFETLDTVAKCFFLNELL